MVDWSVLGIQETKDIKSIKQAYRARLAQTNPEDKPEEFMALRAAYDEALAYARGEGEYAQDTEDTDGEAAAKAVIDGDLLPPDHPAYLWTKQLQAIYKDFSRRIDPAAWEALLQDPLVSRIDTADDTLDAILRLLMEHWFVPDSVVSVLDKTYHFEENTERLCAKYPKGFVDAILLTPLMRDSGGFDYPSFSIADDATYADYDTFIQTYYTLTEKVARRENAEGWQLVETLEASPVWHPYLEVEKTKLYLNEDKVEEAAAVIATVWPAYSHVHAVACMAGEVSLIQKDLDEALVRFQKGLDCWSNSLWARIGLGETYYELKQYDDAEDLIGQVLAVDRYNRRAKDLEAMIDEAVKAQLIEKATQGAGSPEAGISSGERLRLGVLHVDNGEFEEGIQVLTGFTLPDKEDEAQRLHYLATAYLDTDRFKEAVSGFRASEALLRELLQVTASEEEQQQFRALICRSMVMQSLPLEHLGRLEEALQTVTNATVDFPHFNMPHCRKAELHYLLKQYPEAVDAATRSIEIDDSFHLPFRIRACANYEMRHYNAAYEDCNASIELYAGDIEAFFCRINVLTAVGETDGALKELDSLESQVQGTRITFLRGRAYQAAGKDAEAKAQMEKVLAMAADKERRTAPEAELKSYEGVYYTLYDLNRRAYEETHDDGAWRDYHRYLQDGIKKFPRSLPFLSAQANELYSRSAHREAQKMYETMVELDPCARHFAQLAGNELQLDYFADAEKHLAVAAEKDPHLTYTQILYGCLFTHRGAFDKALAAYEQARTLAEENEEVWYRILREEGQIYARMQQYDRAVECLRKNYDLYHQVEDLTTLMEILRRQGKVAEAEALGKEYLKEHEGEPPCGVLSELMRQATDTGDEAAFLRYHAMDTRPYDANHLAGRFYMYRADSYEKALDYFLKAEAHGKNRIDNNLEIARLYLKLKDKKKAASYAQRVLDAVPKDFEQCGYDRAYYLSRSAEALVVLGKYREAKSRIEQAIDGRKCDFCTYSGCIDAYCALLYLYCVLGKKEEAEACRKEGLKISPHDYDLLHLEAHYMMKKKGLFR